MNLGILIISIVALGYISNWLNWRYLNYKIVHLSYYVGVFIHETSHAVFCLLTGAKIMEYKIFSRQPQVVHSKPRWPLVGQPLISLAPLIGGLLFLFFVNKYFLTGYFEIPQFSSWQDALMEPIKFLTQINLFAWQSWVMILLFLNVGAMIGPSLQDLKNIWPILIIFFFVKSSLLINLSLLVIILVLVNIAIQIILMLIIKTIKVITRNFPLASS